MCPRWFIFSPRSPSLSLLFLLAANNSYSMAKILNWNSETWNSESAKVLLNNLQKNKGQTNETREHAALILSWINLRQSINSSSSSDTVPSNALSESSPSNRLSAVNNQEKGTVRNRHDSDISSTMSPRSSLHLETDNGTLKIGCSDRGEFTPRLHFIDLFWRYSDIFFHFSIIGHSKTGTIHQYGITELQMTGR